MPASPEAVPNGYGIADGALGVVHSSGFMATLLGMVTKRIGLARYEAAWEGMRQDRAYTPAVPIDCWQGESVLSTLDTPGVVQGVVLYDAHAHTILEQIHSQVRALLLESYALPPHGHVSPSVSPIGYRDGRKVTPQSVSSEVDVQSRGDATVGEKPIAAGGDEVTVMAIESFKQVIRAQDEAARQMKLSLEAAQAEAREARAAAAAAAAESAATSIAEAESLRLEVRRLKDDLLSAREEADSLRAELAMEAERVADATSAGRAELEAMTVAYTQAAAALARREQELAEARFTATERDRGDAGVFPNSDQNGNTPSGGEAADGRLQSNSTEDGEAADAVFHEAASSMGGDAATVARMRVQLRMLQSHADGLARDLQKAIGEVEAANAELDAAKAEVEATKAEAEAVKAEAQAAKAEAHASKAGAEAAMAEAEMARKEADAVRAQAEAEAASAMDTIADSKGTRDTNHIASFGQAMGGNVGEARMSSQATEARLAEAEARAAAAEAEAKAVAASVAAKVKAAEAAAAHAEDARAAAEAASAQSKAALSELELEHEELLICLAEQDALTQALQAQLAGASPAYQGAATPATGKASHSEEMHMPTIAAGIDNGPLPL